MEKIKIIKIDTAYNTSIDEKKVSDLLEEGYTITGKFCPDRYLIIVLEKLPEKAKSSHE